MSPEPENGLNFRCRLWKLATKLYSGYEDYQARATHRRIAVIVLEPAKR